MLTSPITIVGDFHVEFWDLLELFEHCEYPSWTNYLFLGDYVDRGGHGFEELTLLFLLKLKYPNYVYLLRNCNYGSGGVRGLEA